jgi:hypothetical protein
VEVVEDGDGVERVGEVLRTAAMVAQDARGKGRGGVAARSAGEV